MNLFGRLMSSTRNPQLRCRTHGGGCYLLSPFRRHWINLVEIESRSSFLAQEEGSAPSLGFVIQESGSAAEGFLREQKRLRA